jgi:hypothetical protein
MLLGSEKVKEESEREALNFVIMTNSLLLWLIIFIMINGLLLYNLSHYNICWENVLNQNKARM